MNAAKKATIATKTAKTAAINDAALKNLENLQYLNKFVYLIHMNITFDKLLINNYSDSYYS
jgi:hypothetical protein